jgi:PqqD family protein of HPr-rel-A system
MDKANGRLADLAVSESGFVFDPHGGGVFTVNRTARTVLELLKEGRESRDIARTLAERFVVEGADVERDVAEFLLVLRRHGLLGPESEP